MPEPAQLAVFVVASAILGITPGPDIVYVVSRGAAQGPRAGGVLIVLGIRLAFQPPG